VVGHGKERLCGDCLSHRLQVAEKMLKVLSVHIITNHGGVITLADKAIALFGHGRSVMYHYNATTLEHKIEVGATCIRSTL
jgi:hypothetical protein